MSSGRAFVLSVLALLATAHAHAQARPDPARLVFAGSALRQVANPSKVPEGLAIQRRGFGIVSHPRLDADLNAVLQDIQRAMPSAPPAARVYATPDPAFRAYASADGAIFIATGVLQSLQSRDELAALIAHEYAHVVLGHSGTSRTREAARVAQGVGTLYLALRHGSAAEMALTSTVVRDVVLHASLVEALQGGMLPARTRQHEVDADLLATDLLVRAGYNPAAMVDFLDKLDTWEAARQAAAKAREAKLVDVGEQMKAHATKGDVGNAVGVAIGGTISNIFTAGGNAFMRGLSRMRREHLAPAKRIERVRDRIDSEHADYDRPDLRPVPWSGQSQVTRLFEGLEATHQFVAAVQAGETDTYAARLRAVKASPAATTAYARYAQLLVYPLSQGKKRSVRDMSAELAREDSLFPAHLLALDVLEEVGSPAEQVAALQVSQKALNEPPELLPYAVRIHRRAGNNAAANQALGACLGQGDTALSNACNGL